MLLRVLACLLLIVVTLAALRPASAQPDLPHPEQTPRGVWPVAGAPDVVRPFAPPAQRWSAGHRGVDLRATSGAPVRAPIAGIVTVARTIVDRGVVVIADGATRTTLEPVVATIGPGDAVAAGDIVGLIERGPSHCPPLTCLHWGLLVGDDYRDPLLLVVRHRAVLLPRTAPD